MTARRRLLTGAYAALSVADTVAVGLGPRWRRVHYVVKPLLMPVLAAALARRLGRRPGGATACSPPRVCRGSATSR